MAARTHDRGTLTLSPGQDSDAPALLMDRIREDDASRYDKFDTALLASIHLAPIFNILCWREQPLASKSNTACI